MVENSLYRYPSWNVFFELLSYMRHQNIICKKINWLPFTAAEILWHNPDRQMNRQKDGQTDRRRRLSIVLLAYVGYPKKSIEQCGPLSFGLIWIFTNFSLLVSLIFLAFRHRIYLLVIPETSQLSLVIRKVHNITTKGSTLK